MLGSAVLGGRKQRRIVDGEVAVVVLHDGQSCPLNTEEEGEKKMKADGNISALKSEKNPRKKDVFFSTWSKPIPEKSLNNTEKHTFLLASFQKIPVNKSKDSAISAGNNEEGEIKT